MGKLLTEAEKQFIRDNHLFISMKEISKQLNRNPATIRRFKKLENIITPKEVVNKFRTHLFSEDNYKKFFKNRNFHSWTIEEEDYLRKYYANTSNKELSEYLNISEGRIGSKAGELKLKKSKEHVLYQRRQIALNSPLFLEKSFQKGVEPYHKGKKMKDVLSPESYLKFDNRSGKFQKGQLPHNSKPIGSKFKRSTDKVTYIKVKEGKWILYSHYLYEFNVAKIPNKYCVRFRDGDNQNFELNNLYLFPKSKLPEENRIKTILSEDQLNQYREVLIYEGDLELITNECNRR